MMTHAKSMLPLLHSLAVVIDCLAPSAVANDFGIVSDCVSDLPEATSSVNLARGNDGIDCLPSPG